MLTAINDIGTEQAEPTKNTQVKIERLLNYTATYLHVKLRFYASGMILQVDSDATYLILSRVLFCPPCGLQRTDSYAAWTGFTLLRVEQILPRLLDNHNFLATC